MSIGSLSAALVAGLFCLQAGASTALDIEPVTLPSEFRALTGITLIADRDEFILSGTDSAWGCMIAVFSRDVGLSASRTFPGVAGDQCVVKSVDSAGNPLVFVRSQSPQFPVTHELIAGSASSQHLLKLTRSSLAVLFSVRLALGAIWDVASGSDNTIWLGGFALRGLPTTPDAIWRYYHDGDFIDPRERAGFLARLSADGQQILYCTYLGGYRDNVATLAISQDGNVYAAGSQIWKFSQMGKLIWSTWLPPSSALGSAIGPDGSLYIVGTTGLGENLYTTPNAFQTTPYLNQSFQSPSHNRSYPTASIDGFAARLSSDGRLIYSTLMGGVGSDTLNEVLVDQDGSAVVRGNSSGRLFPTRAASALVARGSVLARLSPDGTMADYSTYTSTDNRFSMFSPVRHPDGGFLMLSYWLAPPNPQELRAFRVREIPQGLPRIDAVVRSGQPREFLRAGESATISGEGFEVVTSVEVGGVPAKILSRSSDFLEIEIPAAFPGFTPQSGFTGDLRLLREGQPIRQIHVQVSLPFPDPGEEP